MRPDARRGGTTSWRDAADPDHSQPDAGDNEFHVRMGSETRPCSRGLQSRNEDREVPGACPRALLEVRGIETPRYGYSGGRNRWSSVESGRDEAESQACAETREQESDAFIPRRGRHTTAAADRSAFARDPASAMGLRGFATGRPDAP